MKKKRYLAVVLLSVILTVVLFLPLILSSDAVLRMVVSRVNGAVPGRLSINSWLVDWQQGLLCQDIVYTDDQKGIRVTIPRLTSTQGLLELLFAPKNLGLVGIDSPVVELSGALFRQKGPSGDDRPSSSVESTSAPWDKLTMQLQIRDGMIKAGISDGGVELGIRNIDFYSSLADGVIDFSLKLQALGEQGVAEVEGALNLPARSRDLAATLVMDAEVTVDNYQLRDYLSFFAPLSNLPTGEGVLKADFKVKIVGIEEVELSGTAGLTGLKLAGGMLGEDTPTFREISLSLEDAEWSRFYWTAKQLNLETDVGTLYFSGERKDKKIEVKSRGTLYIPVLFDQFPHLLRIQEETFIESGSLDFTADLAVDGVRGKFEVKAQTENLGGLFDGTPFVWDNPLTAIFYGEKDGLDFRVRRLQIDTPFARAYGQGNLRSFDLEASADVGATLVEIGKLFQHPWSGTGQLELSAKASGGESEDKNYTVETDLSISNLSLSRSDTVIIPRHDFSIVGSGQAPLSLLKNKTGMFDLQFALSSWIGEVFLALNGERGEKNLLGSRYSTDTNLNLDTLSAFLHTLDKLPQKIRIAGDLQVQATGYVDRSTLEINELNSWIEDFSFSQDEVVLQDKKISLQIVQSVNDKVPSLAIHDLVVSGNRAHYFNDGAGVNSIHFPERSLFLHNIRMETGLGKLQLDELIVKDWLEPLKNFDTEFLVNGDLKKLTPFLHNFDILESGTNLSGTGQLILHAIEKNKAGQDIQVDLQLDEFSLSRQNKDLLRDEKIELTANLTGQVADGDFTIRKIQLNSGPLDMEAVGTLKSLEKGKVLELKGAMIPKMDQLASIINNTFDLGVVMQGRQEGPFEVKYHLGARGGDEKRKDRFMTTLLADKVEYKGVEFGELKLPVSLQDNNLQAELTGRMNDGLLNLVTDITFNLGSPVLSMPHAGQIMTGVQLNKPVVDGLLQGVHPLFGVLATPTGKIDVVVDSLYWPLEKGGEQEADFVVIINSREVSFESTGFMQGILGSFGLDKEKITLKDSKINCIGRGGRIACSPIRILVGGSEMVLSGSVGMDKTLDYILQIPITERLVGREGYRVLEGTTIRVPIRGTSGKPDFNQKMVTAALEDLVKQAAAKAIEKKAVEILPGLIEGILGSPRQQ